MEAAIVAAAAAASAWNTHYNGFVWDDRAAIVGNADVRGDRAIWEAFTHDFWGTPIRAIESHKSYRPLTVLSFRLNRVLAGGAHPRLFHATNALVHVGCALLVWRVARALFRKFHRAQVDLTEFPQIGPLLAALIFAVHPVHSDAIASIVGRADLLCTLLSLQAFRCYMHAVDASDQTHWRAFVLALVFAVAASLCKELGFTVLGLFLAYDCILQLSYHARKHRSVCATTGSASETASTQQQQHRAFRERTRVLVLFTLALTATRVWINGEHRQMQWNILANDVALQPSRLTRVLSYAHIHAWYLWKLVWPRSLCFDYGFATVPLVTSFNDVHNLYTLAAYVAVALGVVVGVQHVAHSPVLMSIAFGVVPFVPVSNLLFPVGTVVAERLLYFPSVGFSLLLGNALQSALQIAYTYGSDRLDARSNVLAPAEASLTRARDGSESHRAPSPLPARLRPPRAYFRWCYSLTTLSIGVVLASGSYRSQLRNAEWIDEPTLFRAALSVSPTNVKVLSNLGKTLLGRDNELAIRLVRSALAMLPTQVEGHTNLGLAHWHLDDWLFAARHLYKSAHFGQDQFQGNGYAGSALLDHWLDEHNVQFTDATATTQAFLRSPTIRMARTLLDKAIDGGSYYPVHSYARARLAYLAGDYDAAVKYCNVALKLNAIVLTKSIDSELVMSAGQVHNLIVISHIAAGRQELALDAIRQGLVAAPDDIDLHANAIVLVAPARDSARVRHHLDALLQLATTPSSRSALELVARVLEAHMYLQDAGACRQRATELADSAHVPLSIQ